MTANLISEQEIESILQAHPIVDFISKHVMLAKKGKNYSGLCPFHSEKTPSFSVNPATGLFKCFGCNVGGNVIHFQMKMSGSDFVATCRELAQAAGITLRVSDREEVYDEQRHIRRQVTVAYKVAADLYHHILLHTDQGKLAREYLDRRGFSREMVERFCVGYVPNLSGQGRDVLTKVLKKKEMPLSLLAEYGLIKFSETMNDYADRFTDRIMFPIHDERGDVVAFGGRLLADRADLPKYLNSQESPIFQKSKLLYHYALAKGEIKQRQSVVICEGYVDAIKIWSAGITNVVATLGTALTSAHLKSLTRQAEQVIVCFDSDAAGQKATLAALDLLAQHPFTVKVAMLPDGVKDPDDFITSFGGEAFRRQVIEESVSAIRFRLSSARRKFKLHDESEKLTYVREALQILSAVRSPTERELYLQNMSNELSLPLHTLKQEFETVYRPTIRSAVGDDFLSLAAQMPADSQAEPRLLPAYQLAERTLLALMCNSAEITRYVMNGIGDGFHVSLHKALAAHLYSYYSRHPGGNANLFLFELDDEQLHGLATAVMMMDLPDTLTPDSKAMQDLIHEIRKRTLQVELNQLQEQLKLFDRSGGQEDPDQFHQGLELSARIIQLQKQLKHSE